MRQNLAHMVSIARRHGVRPALLGMQLPPNYGAAYTAAFAAVYAQVAAAAEVPLLPFFLAGLETDRALFQADQIHPQRRRPGANGGKCASLFDRLAG